MISSNQKKSTELNKLPVNTRIALVISPYYSEITDNLVSGAMNAISAANISAEMIEVAGALEIPGAISLARKHFEGFVALGCVIRGETSHYEIVSQNSAQGLMQLSTQGICIGNGIITVENVQQALERSNPDNQDKGGDAARAAIGLMLIRLKYDSI